MYKVENISKKKLFNMCFEFVTKKIWKTSKSSLTFKPQKNTQKLSLLKEKKPSQYFLQSFHNMHMIDFNKRKTSHHTQKKEQFKYTRSIYIATVLFVSRSWSRSLSLTHSILFFCAYSLAAQQKNFFLHSLFVLVMIFYFSPFHTEKTAMYK